MKSRMIGLLVVLTLIASALAPIASASWSDNGGW